MLEMTPFKEMLDEKWNNYAQWQFYFSILWYVIYLMAICFAVIRPFPGDNSIFLIICEAFILLTVASNIFSELLDLKTLSWKRYCSDIGQFPSLSGPIWFG